MGSALSMARKCIGTPFVIHGRAPGIGMDCVGLIIVAARAQESFPEDFDFNSYRVVTANSTMVDQFKLHFKEIDVGESGPGDFGIFKVRRRKNADYSHAGILTNRGLIHACMSAGKVVETVIYPEWLERGWKAFRFKEKAH